MSNFLNSEQERTHPFKITVGYKSSLTHVCKYICGFSCKEITLQPWSFSLFHRAGVIFRAWCFGMEAPLPLTPDTVRARS